MKAGESAYLYYRFQSSMVHPTAFLADFYLEDALGTPAGCALMMEPQTVDAAAWPVLTVASMMWAHRALDHLSTDHTYRSRLRAIAQELGVPETVELTEEARQEAALSEQRRRRGNWRSPRRRA